MTPRQRCVRAVGCLAMALCAFPAFSRLSAAEGPAPSSPGATRLGITDTAFTLNDRPTFLLGISYYGALGAPEESIRGDLADMKRHGFNWTRVWATWAASGKDVSAIDGEGNPRESYLAKLKWLVAECDRQGLVVDVTLSRGIGASGKPRLQTYDAHRRAVETIVAALKDYRNWYLDLSNERNIRDSRFTSLEDLRKLRAAVRGLDPQRLVTASHAGDMTRDELREYLLTVGADFIAVHRPRHAKSPAQTAAKVPECLTWMRELGRTAPVHCQEPFRRGYARGDWEPAAADFVADLRAARSGGAAGWCFHNGDQRDRPDKQPQRSFDLSQKRLFEQLDPEEQKFLTELRSSRDESPQTGAADAAPFRPTTRVAIADGRWRINGEVTYRGAKAEGLLMNVRMVNAVFEDRKRPDFDPQSNTARFLAQVPDYAAHGVRAFTICLQGGFPGYEGVVNSAFDPDGSLRDAYLRRVRRVVETCDRHGLVVIVGCYYQRQDQILKDADAVRAGVVNVVRWIQQCGFTNVVLEVANEFPHGGFDHRILKTPEGEAELVRLAKKTMPGLLVSTSGIGDGKLPDAVAEASDFLLIHFNGVHVEQIPQRIAALRRFRKPIVCNEDDKIGEVAARACELSVTSGASWGFMHIQVNQYHPFKFQGAADDPMVYVKLKEVASLCPTPIPTSPR